MFDLTKYNLKKEDILFLTEIEDICINGQNEVILEYKEESFVLEPHGKEVQVYAYGKILGIYKSFDNLLLNHKVKDKTLIEIVDELKYGE